MHTSTLQTLCTKPDETLLQEILFTTQSKSNLIGKGGFGAVFNHNGLALKIVRVDSTNNRKINAMLEEISVSKKLSNLDTEKVHFPTFENCFYFGHKVSDYVSEMLQPANGPAAHEIKNDIGLTNFIYIGILMERLEKNLTWFMFNYGIQMDLAERSRMAIDLANHLKFMNDDLNLSHCDIKPDNFMLNQLVMKSHYPNGVVSAYSLFFNDFKMFKSKVIDFGGVVPYDKPCTTYTLGFVPFNDMFNNASFNTDQTASKSNDMFAFATIFMYMLTNSRPFELLNINMSLHRLIKQIVSLENEWYTQEISKDKQKFIRNIQQYGKVGVRRLAIKEIAPKVVEMVPEEVSLLKITWQIISSQESLEDNEFVIQVFTETDNFLGLLEALYATYIGTVTSDREYMAKLEIVRLFESYGMDIDNYNEYLADVDLYVSQETKFMNILGRIYTFFSQNQPNWTELISEFSEIEVAMTNLIKKIQKAAKKVKTPNRAKGIHFDVFSTFMSKALKEELNLPQEVFGSCEMRILTKIENVPQSNKSGPIVISKELQNIVMDQTREAVNKLKEKNKGVIETRRFKSYNVPRVNMEQLLAHAKTEVRKRNTIHMLLV
jgi:serine/threonine protein kinase